MALSAESPHARRIWDRITDSADHLEAPWDDLVRGNPVLEFVDTLLRGTGQVMFQNNPITGLLFLVGILVNAILNNAYPLFWGALIGLVSSTVAAMVLSANQSFIRAGFFGYNGILVGIGLAFFLRFDGTLIGYIVLGAVVSTVVLAALANFLSTWDMPALTAPFVFTTWLFMFAVFEFARLHVTPLIAPAPLSAGAAVQTGLQPLQTSPGGTAGVTIVNILQAFFRGVGEVFFQDNPWTGLIFLVAILVNSRISALFAAIGSTVGLITALVFLNGSGYWVYHGLYGFNAVLCGIAIGGLFYVLSWKSALYAVVCALVSTVVMAAISVFLSPLGMPALTAPFVFTTWLFLFPKAGFSVLQPVPLADVTKPEQIWQAFQAKQGSVREGLAAVRATPATQASQTVEE